MRVNFVTYVHCANILINNWLCVKLKAVPSSILAILFLGGITQNPVVGYVKV